MAWWSDQGIHHKETHDDEWYLQWYAIIALSSIFFYSIMLTIKYFAQKWSSKALHDEMLQAMLRAPNGFYDVTPRGRIINRFSKDVYSVDEIIPWTMTSFFSQFWYLLFSFTLMIVILPWFALVLFPLLLMYYFVQLYYISTS